MVARLGSQPKSGFPARLPRHLLPYRIAYGGRHGVDFL